MDLSGKTILITREAKQSELFAHLVEKYKGIPIIFPTIEITEPQSWDECDKAINNIDTYNGLIFTSANGVKYFFDRYKKLGAVPARLKNKVTFAVGIKTKYELEQLGLTVAIVPEKYSSFDLTQSIEYELVKGKNFLFPRGNLANDTLSKDLKSFSANVDEITVYNTQQPKQADINQLKDLLLQKRINVITFTSPSTFNNFVILFTTGEVEKIFANTKIAVIGPATAKRVREAGFKVDIKPYQSTIESMLHEIIDYYQPNYKRTK